MTGTATARTPSRCAVTTPTSSTNSLYGGDADVELTYGQAGDDVLVGDWDGDGSDSFAVRRGNSYFISNTLQSGWAETELDYGQAGDDVLVGDYDGDGVDTFTVRRGNTYFISNTLQSGWADSELDYGRASDEVYVGDWDGDARRIPSRCVVASRSSSRTR